MLHLTTGEEERKKNQTKPHYLAFDVNQGITWLSGPVFALSVFRKDCYLLQLTVTFESYKVFKLSAFSVRDQHIVRKKSRETMELSHML